MSDNINAKSHVAIWRAKLAYMLKEEQILNPPIKLTMEPEIEDPNQQTVKITNPIIPGQNSASWNTLNTTSREVKVYNGGGAKPYLETMEQYDLLCTQRGGNTSQHRNLYKALLGTQMSKRFAAIEAKLRTENEALPADQQQEAQDLFKRAVNRLAQSVFPNWKHAVRNQKRYMRQLVILPEMSVEEFTTQLERMNNCLQYFPVKDEPELQKATPLTTEELIEHIDLAKKPHWQTEMQRQNLSYTDFDSVDKIQSLFTSFEQADSMDGFDYDVPKDNQSNGRKRKRTRANGKENKRSTKASKKFHKCKHCGKVGAHAEDDCWELDKNKDKRPKGWKSVKGENAIESTTFSLKSDYVVPGEIQRDQKRLKITTDVTNSLHSIESQAKAPAQESTSRKRNLATMEDTSQREAKELQYETFCPMVAMLSQNSDKSISNEEEFDGYPDYLKEYLHPFFNRDELTKKAKLGHYTAEIVVEILDRNGKLVPIRGLLDTGATSSLLLRDFVKKGRANGYSGKTTEWKTKGGIFKTKKKALVDFKFPELNVDKKVTWVCHVDETTNREQALYDMIIGMDLMTAIGIYVDTDEKVIRWGSDIAPLSMKGALDNENTLQHIYAMTQDSPILQQAEERQARIRDADYSAVDIPTYVASLNDLTTIEKQQLQTVLEKHPTLFQGGLGILDIKPVHLELKEGAKPYHAKAFPIPQAYEGTTKREINRLEGIKVLKKTYDSEWAAPTFIQPKKTGDVRVLTDFRRLNDMILRKPFPLPKISDLLQKLSGFTYATAIDLSMGYYHIPLDEDSQKLCTTILPWGKYQWCRLPMGVKCAPDIFQAIISDLFHDLDWVRGYIDDILITSTGDYADHLAKVDLVLARLEKVGFRARLQKCFFAQTELEYLGYWLTCEGIQPQPKKVEAILRLQAPKTVRQLRRFLGLVNFYRDMWRRRSHLLSPLTPLVGKKTKWSWGPEQQEAFDEIKKVISKETLLAFPDFTKEFHIYTDASDYQLGSVIMQEGRPLAFYSRKMTNAQKGYTTGEQELLSIVETLKEFRNILLGQKLIVHTDHKNILYHNLSNDRIARWRTILEEYGPEYKHIAGKDNVVADALSRLEADFDFDMEAMEKQPEDIRAQICACALSQLCRDESVIVPDKADAEEFIEQIMASSENISEKFPMSPCLIAKSQKKDKALMNKAKDSKHDYGTKTVEGFELITYQNKIVVPKILQGRIIAWYHEYLVHPGSTRLEQTLSQTLW